MKKFTLLLTMLLLMISSLAAADRQFYFVGEKTRLGSLSSMDKDKEGIYLRWDLIEGDMPEDVTEFTLLRIDSTESNTTLLDVDAQTTMEDRNISTMYHESSSQRRLFEAITMISNNDDANCSDANVANIGQKINSCLENNYWSFLASRVNFDIARARYRAYLDTDYDKTAGKIKYILLGKNYDATKEIVLGEVTIDLTQQTHVSPAVDLKQVITSKCNDNRYGLDDGRVALSWKNGGKNKTEFFANNIMVSGYDIYYSTVPSAEFNTSMLPTAVDLAALAATKMHDGNGEVDLSEYHLAKANDTLITLGSQDVNETQPVYIEKKETLLKRGFHPGEKRTYFLVPKDFTGNYGPTVYIEVVIPDLLPPVAPINPRVIEVDKKAKLIWDAVTFQNYVKYNEATMKACTTATIDKSSRVRFVNKDEMCNESQGVVLNFNVDKYRVYRFQDAVTAAGFEDLDLDGYNDFDETDEQKCSPKTPLNATNYLASEIANNSTTQISFQDQDVKEGVVYWYRLASVTKSGVVSHLSAPIRAFIPKRNLFKAPDINVTYTALSITTVVNEDNRELLVKDETGDFTSIKLYVEGKYYSVDIVDGECNIPEALKQERFVNEQFTHLGTITFMKGGLELTSRNFTLRDIFQFGLLKTDENERKFSIDYATKHFLLAIEQKELVAGTPVAGGCVDITFSDEFLAGLSGNGCVETTVAIGNGRYKSSRDCNITKTKTICEETKNADLVSVGISKVLYSGLRSQSSFINFVPVTAEVPIPNKPALRNLEMDQTNKKAVISLRPQIEKVTGTLLRLYSEDNKSKVFLHTFTHIGKNNPQEDLNVSIENLGELTKGETWCVKAKTIGLMGKMSDWSNLLCTTIGQNPEDEVDNLDWPKLKKLEKITNSLDVDYSRENENIEITLIKAEKVVETNTVPTLKKADGYTNIIAKDSKGTTQQVKVGFFVGEDTLKENIVITINSSGEYILPSKGLDIRNAEDAKAITHITLDFLSSAGANVFPDSIVLEGENILQISNNAPVVNQYVDIENITVEDSCGFLSDLANGYNKQGWNFIVYRQTLLEGNVGSNFVQVSPLITKASCTKMGELEMSNNLVIESQGTQRVVKFVDRYPYVAGEKYSYVVVIFDEISGEPLYYLDTNPKYIQVY